MPDNGGVGAEDAGTDTAEQPDQKRGEGDAGDLSSAWRQTIQCGDDEPGQRPDEQCEQEYGAGNAGHRVRVMKRIDVPGLEEGVRDGQRVEHCQTGTLHKWFCFHRASTSVTRMCFFRMPAAKGAM